MALSPDRIEFLAHTVARKCANRVYKANQTRDMTVLSKTLQEMPLGIHTRGDREDSLAVYKKARALVQSPANILDVGENGNLVDLGRQGLERFDDMTNMVDSLRREAYIANTPIHQRVREAFVEKAGNIIGKMAAVF